jgi:hypothetical protein
LNLDGQVEESDFIGRDDESGIDNQLYRVIGCIGGMRAKGVIAENANSAIRTEAYNRTLLEVTGVDDLQNDASVDVTTYRGLDPVVADGANNAVPWTSQRIDTKRRPVRRGGQRLFMVQRDLPRAQV